MVDGQYLDRTGTDGIALSGTALLALSAGDSFTKGQNLPNVNYHFPWPYRSAKRLGIARMYDLAIGSTGYVANGPSRDGSRRRLVDQIAHDWNWGGVHPHGPAVAGSLNGRGAQDVQMRVAQRGHELASDMAVPHPYDTGVAFPDPG